MPDIWESVRQHPLLHPCLNLSFQHHQRFKGNSKRTLVSLPLPLLHMRPHLEMVPREGYQMWKVGVRA